MAHKAANIGRDHNATSYSTETKRVASLDEDERAEIITLRAIALKHLGATPFHGGAYRRDHNATSYSTETQIVHK